MKAEQTYTLGILYALTAALFWGLSGVFVQFLVSDKNINIAWLVSTRLLVSGVILLILGYFQNKKQFFGIFRDKNSLFQLIIFSIFGMVMVQYSYFAAIENSNASTATIIQYTAPVLICIYYAISRKSLPPIREILAVFLAISGIFLLVTQGQINNLYISELGLFWGVISALSLAFYTVYPIPLLNKWPSILVIGWSMLLGGIAFSFFKSPLDFTGIADYSSISMIAFIVLLATAFAFCIFLVAVKWLGATKASLIATSEPLAATLIAIAWLNIPFTLLDGIGGTCIILAMIILTVKKRGITKS